MSGVYIAIGSIWRSNNTDGPQSTVQVSDVDTESISFRVVTGSSTLVLGRQTFLAWYDEVEDSERRTEAKEPTMHMRWRHELKGTHVHVSLWIANSERTTHAKRGELVLLPGEFGALRYDLSREGSRDPSDAGWAQHEFVDVEAERRAEEERRVLTQPLDDFDAGTGEPGSGYDMGEDDEDPLL